VSIDVDASRIGKRTQRNQQHQQADQKADCGTFLQHIFSFRECGNSILIKKV
jgi:hypothetical protein